MAVFYGAADAAPAIPAAESTLGSHPCVALSSAQVLPEWINRNLAVNAFAANGDNPLNFVSHSRGSLQFDGLKTCSALHVRLSAPAQKNATADCAEIDALKCAVALFASSRRIPESV